MNKTNHIAWNSQLRIAFSDVDETIADVYTPADDAITRRSVL